MLYCKHSSERVQVTDIDKIAVAFTTANDSAAVYHKVRTSLHEAITKDMKLGTKWFNRFYASKDPLMREFALTVLEVTHIVKLQQSARITPSDILNIWKKIYKQQNEIGACAQSSIKAIIEELERAPSNEKPHLVKLAKDMSALIY